MSNKDTYRSMEYIRSKVIDPDVENIIKNAVITNDLIDGGLAFDGKITPVVIVNPVPLSIVPATFSGSFSDISINAGATYQFTVTGFIQILPKVGTAPDFTVYEEAGATDYYQIDNASGAATVEGSFLTYVVASSSKIINNGASTIYFRIFWLNVA